MGYGRNEDPSAQVRSAYHQNGYSGPASSTANPASQPDAVLFSSCKGETHTHKAGYKQLFRRLRSLYKPESLDSADDLNVDSLRHAAVLVFGCPQQRFTTSEFEALRGFVRGGGGLLVLLQEGGERRAATNINYLLEEFGIVINNDAVIRTAHHKYMHPKEVLVRDGILHRGLLLGGDGSITGGKRRPTDEEALDATGGGVGGSSRGGLDFVYPHGATLTVQKPAVPILSSGKISYPVNCPLGAVWSQEGAGRIAVLGSVHMFDDKWIDKEENSRLVDALFKWLRPGSQLVLDPSEADESELNDLKLLPDTQSLADRVKGCLQEVDEVPSDWTTLFDDNLFKFDTSLVPEAAALYDKLNVKKAPLTLITPQFETPLPPLQPAVFPPAVREPPPPALELFDLDEHFASEQSRLAYLTNKCSGQADMEYYIMEAAHIAGIKLQEGATAKAALAEVFKSIVQYKMVGGLRDQDGQDEDMAEMNVSSSSNVDPLNQQLDRLAMDMQ